MTQYGLDGVWSERDEPYTEDHSWRDCSYATSLMMLYGAGFRAFPLGAYTVNEREAFERSDDAVDESGGNFVDTDVAMSRRYGLLPFKQFTTGTTIEQMLQTSGNLVGLLGNNGVFPYGDPWRKNSKNFNGFHVICFATIGSTSQVMKFDPLALWHADPEVESISKILEWALGTSAYYARYIKIGDIASLVPLPPAPINPMEGFPVKFKPINRSGTVGAGVNLRTSPHLLATNKTSDSPTAAPLAIFVMGETLGDSWNGTDRWFVFWRVNSATTDQYDGQLLYVHASLVVLK